MNPTRLTLARKRRHYTKSRLAELIDVHLRAVVAYEAGEYAPSEDTMAKIESVLGFPPDFFNGDDLDEPNPNTASFRALSKMAAKQRDAALAQGALAMEWNRWLEQRFELPMSALPDLSRESTPESAAESIRAFWGLGELSIRNVVHLLEAKGVRVFSLAIDAREVDAFSMWKGNTPFVFLNCYKSSEHSRFDAAHELGHLVLHKQGAPQGREAEREANRFASAFLMPSGSVHAHLPRFVTVDQLIRLKKIWITSVSAVNYRLHVLKLISDWNYYRLCIEIAKRGFQTAEPEEAPRETSLILPKLLSALHREGIGRSRIASELGIPLAELEQLLFGLAIAGIDGGRQSVGASASSRPQQRLRRVK